jgi:twitching motility protein PilT
MAQIDKYIQHLLRFEALSLMVTSNGPVVARLSSGAEKASTQTVEHALLVAAVHESAPAAALADIRSSRMTKFQYPLDAPTVTVEVTPTPGAWKLLLTPLPTDATAAPPVSLPPAVSAPPRPSAPSIDRQPRIEPARPLAGEAPRVSAADSPRLSRPDISRVDARPESPPAAYSSVTEPVGALEDDRPGDTTGIDLLLRHMARVGASDLHLATGRPPMMRLHGEIRPLPGDHLPLTAEALRALILPTMKVIARKEYAEHNDADYAHEIAGLARFRCNALVERRGPSAVLRRIPMEIVPAEDLGLSRAVLDLCDLPKGLVLMTGPTGSGKSTTLASVIDRINTHRKDHIITIEDPIEFVHRNKRCLVNQREVGVHTDGFKQALRAALREDPDVVMVGELRDLETTAIAIETAETGHLVFGTLHTRTAPSTIDRIIDQFPAERQPQIRAMLADSLKGVISQSLCKRIGGGRIAVYEVLLVTPAVSNLIREGKTFQLYGVMQTSRQLGMIPQHDALCEMVRSGKVDIREAYSRSYSKSDFRTSLHHAGITLPPGISAREA